LRHEILLFSLQFSATLINLARNGQILRKSGIQGKLAQNGQMLFDNCWAIRLIATIDFHVSHTASPVATGGIWWAKPSQTMLKAPPNCNTKTINKCSFVNIYNVKASTGKKKTHLDHNVG